MDVHDDHRADGFSWKNRHGNALRRDHLAPRDPFFSAPCTATGGSNNRSIHAPQLLVDRSRFYLRCLQTPQDLVQGSVTVPLVEQIPDRRPPTKFLRKITPGRARSQNPQDTVHDCPSIARRPTGPSWPRKDTFDTRPFVIRHTMPYHDNALLGIRFSTVSPQADSQKRPVFRQSLELYPLATRSSKKGAGDGQQACRCRGSW